LSGAGACGKATASTPAGRCGYGQRLPLVVISRYAKTSFVDHSLADQSSILRFIEDNWNLGRIGGTSFDAMAGSLLNLFEFDDGGDAHKLYLDPATGRPR
jgi:phospholipase C